MCVCVCLCVCVCVCVCLLVCVHVCKIAAFMPRDVLIDRQNNRIYLAFSLLLSLSHAVRSPLSPSRLSQRQQHQTARPPDSTDVLIVAHRLPWRWPPAIAAFAFHCISSILGNKDQSVCLCCCKHSSGGSFLGRVPTAELLFVEGYRRTRCDKLLSYVVSSHHVMAGVPAQVVCVSRGAYGSSSGRGF